MWVKETEKQRVVKSKTLVRGPGALPVCLLPTKENKPQSFILQSSLSSIKPRASNIDLIEIPSALLLLPSLQSADKGALLGDQRGKPQGRPYCPTRQRDGNAVQKGRDLLIIDGGRHIDGGRQDNLMQAITRAITAQLMRLSSPKHCLAMAVKVSY